MICIVRNTLKSDVAIKRVQQFTNYLTVNFDNILYIYWINSYYLFIFAKNLRP